MADEPVTTTCVACWGEDTAPKWPMGLHLHHFDCLPETYVTDMSRLAALEEPVPEAVLVLEARRLRAGGAKDDALRELVAAYHTATIFPMVQARLFGESPPDAATE